MAALIAIKKRKNIQYFCHFNQKAPKNSETENYCRATERMTEKLEARER